jgi:amino acid transporter
VKRNLSLLALVSVIFFNVCGGPYALEPVLNAGPGLALTFLVLTPFLWAMPVALVCAELGTALPEEGGYYAWSKRALGPFWAFCQGWWAWLFTIVDLVLYPKMFCQYLAYFDPRFGEDGDILLHKGLIIAVIWLFVLLNLAGARTVGGMAKLFAVMVIAPFAVMVGWGLLRALTNGFPHSPTTPFLQPGLAFPAAVAASLPYALWNYQGWDAISTIAGEMEHPRRDYPRALALATLLIVAVYSLPAFVGLGFVPVETTWETGTWSHVAHTIAGAWLGTWVSLAGMVSSLGLFASLVLVYSRIPFVMADDGYLPGVFSRCNVYGAPTTALLVCGSLYTAVVVVFRDFEELAEVDVTLFAAVMTLELASFLALRRLEPNLPRPFRVPGGWAVAGVICVVPILCVSTSIFYRSQDAGAWPVIGKALVMMATGPLIYPLVARHRRLVKEKAGGVTHLP